ncbi:MAG: PaaI family thioesterase [Aquabacterium sp.]|nr:PaaI family thioesterase [Aquabacterium sp.]
MAIPFAVRIPFIEQIGCEMQRYENGEAEITLDVQDQHTNSFGVAHGGLMMTLLDVAMAHAARSLNLDQPDGGPGLVTIEMKTTFMRPGIGRIKALGQVMHSTASLAFTEGKVLDSKGRVCAHATATFKFLRALPVSDREVRPAAKPLLHGPGSD